MSAREAILEAADKLFGEAGFVAATTREIAELSGVNKALIHYHFKSKEALFENVLDRYYERLGHTLLHVLERENGAQDKIGLLIDAYVDFLKENKNFSRIVQREASGGTHLERILHHMEPMFRTGTEFLSQAYPKTCSGDLAASHLLISFYGMIISYFTYSPLLERLFEEDPLDEENLERRKRHLHRMVKLVLDSLHS